MPHICVIFADGSAIRGIGSLDRLPTLYALPCVSETKANRLPLILVWLAAPMQLIRLLRCPE
jgi:hypothetical protein